MIINNKIKSVIFGFLFSVIFSFTNFSVQCDNINKKTLRLHIIPNSNSPEDQELKIKIKDKLINTLQYELSEQKNINYTKYFIKNNINKINNIIQEEISKNNFDYNFKTELTNMCFETKYYENTVYPAGNYQALRITIGNGAGKNWWCVMFPPMCISVSSNKNNINNNFSKQEQNIITNPKKYKIKLKILELLY